MVDLCSLKIFSAHSLQYSIISIVFVSMHQFGCTSPPKHAVQITPKVLLSTAKDSPRLRKELEPQSPPTETRDCQKPVVISEIMTDPEASTDKFGEYVEIVNAGITTVSLNRWKLRNNRAQEYNFPETSLFPGDTLVVGGSLDPDLTANVAVDLMWKVFSLPNRRGLLHLSDPCGNSIDRIQYAENMPWQKRRAGRAIERVNYSSSSDTPHKLWRIVQSRMPSGDFGSPGFVSRKILNHLRHQVNSSFQYSETKKTGSSTQTADNSAQNKVSGD